MSASFVRTNLGSTKFIEQVWGDWPQVFRVRLQKTANPWNPKLTKTIFNEVRINQDCLGFAVVCQAQRESMRQSGWPGRVVDGPIMSDQALTEFLLMAKCAWEDQIAFGYQLSAKLWVFYPILPPQLAYLILFDLSSESEEASSGPLFLHDRN